MSLPLFILPLLLLVLSACGKAPDCDAAWVAIEAKAAGLGYTGKPPISSEQDVLTALGEPAAKKTYSGGQFPGHYMWRWDVLSNGDTCGKYLVWFGNPEASGSVAAVGREDKFSFVNGETAP